MIEADVWKNHWESSECWMNFFRIKIIEIQNSKGWEVRKDKCDPELWKKMEAIRAAVRQMGNHRYYIADKMKGCK